MFTKTITPRFGDADGLRHINNTRLPIWFELGRDPFFRFFNPEMLFEKWNLIMAHIDVDFVAPLLLGAEIEIRTYVAKVGNTSFTSYQEAWQNGQLCAKGNAVVVHYDFKNRKPLPIPDDIRARLLEHRP
ncbi:MAG TPA: thioesterase family protein [Kiritimatiellia bacterium]|jgi:acyl-CoA thioester hydrolase|nr:thioesterase family protein [Kiritimatiellia bacterium]HOE37506.1 thioesterase family protein [Kiritimatiellia bacterium]HOR73946.1 thioesterase family protein [Kiritimatiellia bacterium]HOU58651.1 thioesterase family protein [Kiritimatiellia bacterium]HPK68947.1 thioesterase family protein [Kiritimatiellia bacterium]